MNAPGKIAYTAEEAAAAIGSTRSRIFDAIAHGQLRSFKDGRRRYITRKALEEFVADRERASMKGAA